jgi:ankyrin repeat protein
MTSSSLSPRPDWDRLLMACLKDQVEVVRELLDNGVSADHANSVGQSALHICAWWGRVECMELLFAAQRSVIVHAGNRLTGATPLHCSIQSSQAALRKPQRLRCIDLLLQHGADPTKLDLLGRTPVEYLDDEDIDRTEILALLEPSQPAIFKALASRRNVDELQTILSRDTTQINAVYQGVTPLLQVVHTWCDDHDDDDDDHAGDSFCTTTFQFLVNNGVADLTATNDNDETAVDLLCTSILQRYKQSKSIEDTALKAWKAAVDMLVEKNATHGASATTVWLEIARRNYLELAELWTTWKISPVGDTIVMNRQSMTPLQFAARSGHAQMVDLLLREYPMIDISHQDQRGQTALQAAQVNGHDEIFQMLQEHLQKQC